MPESDPLSCKYTAPFTRISDKLEQDIVEILLELPNLDADARINSLSRMDDKLEMYRERRSSEPDYILVAKEYTRKKIDKRHYGRWKELELGANNH